MGYFIGQFEHSLDDKGRVIVPSRLREMIDVSTDGEAFFVVPGMQGCLLLFTRSSWNAAAERLDIEARADRSGETQNMKRKFFASSEQLNWDKQGRILVPESKRRSAGLNKDVVFIGNGDHIELWDAEKFRQFNEATDPAYDDFVSRLF